MKANELLKKLGSKLLGKKSNSSAPGSVAVKEPAPDTKALEIVFPVHDGLGIIQLHANRKN